MPDDDTVSHATNPDNRCAASAPSAPSTQVASPSGHSTCVQSFTAVAASAGAPNAVQCTRTMAYTPTLVMMANNAATGAQAAA